MEAWVSTSEDPGIINMIPSPKAANVPTIDVAGSCRLWVAITNPMEEFPSRQG